MVLVEELQRARWFSGKSRAIREALVVDRAAWVTGAEVCLVEVRYEVGPPETYVLAEGLEHPAIARALLDGFRRPPVPSQAGGRVVFTPGRWFLDLARETTEPIALMRGEQSNTSIRFGDAVILKLFRRLQFGPNPDVEVGYFLTEHTRFRATPAVLGSIDYVSSEGVTASLALLQRFERNRGDAWTTTRHRLTAILDGGGDTEASIEAMARLGRTTADLHVALANGSGDFAAEPIQDSDVAEWRQAILDEVYAAGGALTRRSIDLDTPSLVRRADGIAGLTGAYKTRHHGDYHLGQVLERDDGSFVIIDFEGEPSKPLAQRRERRSPLRDVAGMLRSLDYARNAALRAGDPADQQRIRRARVWHTRVREAFLGKYLEAVRREAPMLLPRDAQPALAALELEKAAYEVLYELNNRPDWLPIPLAALQPSATLPAMADQSNECRR
ncbi:MAG: sugar phosphotransferase [Chloroflexota bacterium]|nr:sugar phosphotransferase [Chloroflexota bacterium]